jgi:uncharacterized protein
LLNFNRERRIGWLASSCAASAVLSTFLWMAAFACSASASGQVASPVDLRPFAGEFTNAADPDTPYSFYLKDSRLVAESERLVPTELTAVSSSSFKMPHADTKFTFMPGGSGRAESVTVSDEAGTVYRRSGEPVHHLFHEYRRVEAMIPMRDGVHLHAVILEPEDIAGPSPILLLRTPYGVDDLTRASFFQDRPDLARSGYIYVCEDMRGRYKSEGEFRMMRPLVSHGSRKAIDESTDAYDTVAWLVANTPGNNGRVGLVGESYAGFLTMMGGIDPHPAVKAISPQAPMIDVWMGDDFFHNGAFRQSFGYDYILAIESGKEFLDVNYGKDKDGKAVDGYEYFLDRGSFANAVQKSGSKMLPTWKLFLKHPAYDSYWRSIAVENQLNSVSVPTLTVGGTYDQEDMYGPQEEYARLEKHDNGRQNFLVLAPWKHGYWGSSSRHLGNVNYTQPVGKQFRANIEAKFFAYYLKDEPGFDVKDTVSFQTGSNQWKYYDHFPPAESRPVNLYLADGGALQWSAASTASAASYVSDPAHPVPYRHQPIQPTYSDGSEWYNWLTEDQRFVTKRSDLAVWKLPALKADLTITGDVTADIFASTTGSDGDLVVKLIDRYPEDDPDIEMRGYQLMINEEIFRGRYLKSFEKPSALRPNSIQEYKFSLHAADHVFKAGHTMMVEIQSSWFPLYDRNPQTFVPNIMTAQPKDFRPATISIYSGPGRGSVIRLPVEAGCAKMECP